MTILCGNFYQKENGSVKIAGYVFGTNHVFLTYGQVHEWFTDTGLCNGMLQGVDGNWRRTLDVYFKDDIDCALFKMKFGIQE